jgi:anti-sigma factor RsiW
MKCSECELRISDYLEDMLAPAERAAMRSHLESCTVCRELADGTREILAWGSGFASYPAPNWLAGRVLASTPPVVRERWLDTLRTAGRWILQPRMAMTVFASVILLGWTLDLDAARVGRWVEDPATVYYDAQGVAYHAWDEAVRTWYGSRVVNEVYCRIEQLREAAP